MIRLAILLLTGLAFAAVAMPPLIHHRPILIWNASASVPVGFYAVRDLTVLERGVLVAVKPPGPLAAFLDRRGYLPSGSALIKRIAALPGQQVCRADRTVTIDGVIVGTAQWRDHAGRSLPVWNGCRTIAADEVFLMNVGVDDSLDGRYFGPTLARSIIGHAVSVWTDDDGDGRFAWHDLQP